MFRHCTMDELLDVRDGRGTGACRRHVAECEPCRVELERLHQRRAALKALSNVGPPRDRWPAVREAYRAERRAARQRFTAWSGLAAAAVVLLVWGLGVAGPGSSVADGVSLDSLMQRSERLDDALREVGTRRRVMDGLTALTIVELEDRVAAVDSAIGLARSASVPATEMQDLWHQRVNLMEALVTSHVQRVSYVGF